MNADNDPKPMVVDEEYNIFVSTHQIEVSLPPLFKALYLLFLKHPDGITVANLQDYSDELVSIYSGIRPGAAPIDAQKRINKLVEPFGTGFNPARTKINDVISSIFQEPLSEYYKITGSAGNPYLINLPRNLLDIRI